MWETKYSGVCRSLAGGWDGDERKKFVQYVQVGSPVGVTDGNGMIVIAQVVKS